MYQNRKINGSSAKALESERPVASIVVAISGSYLSY
jgi:hypothetical protein